MSHSTLSTLEESVASHETPGSKFYQPFTITPELEAEADMRISHYPESKRAAVLLLFQTSTRGSLTPWVKSTAG